MTTSNMDKSQEWIVIGIGGVTCGGKTSLANKLMQALSPVYVFHQDMYFFPDDSPKHVKCATLPHNNYDIVSSLDMERMYSDVLETIRGANKAHDYSLEEQERFTVIGKKFLILEGFTVLNFKPILDICNLRYFYVLEYGECRLRRSFRLYDPPDIEGYFELCVWPEHLKYRAEIEKDKRVTLLDGTKSETFEMVMADVRALASTQQLV